MLLFNRIRDAYMPLDRNSIPKYRLAIIAIRFVSNLTKKCLTSMFLNLYSWWTNYIRITTGCYVKNNLACLELRAKKSVFFIIFWVILMHTNTIGPLTFLCFPTWHKNLLFLLTYIIFIIMSRITVFIEHFLCTKYCIKHMCFIQFEAHNQPMR